MSELSPRGRLWVRVRITLLTAALLAATGVILNQAWDLQVNRHDELREMAEQQYLRNLRLAPKRGTIYDRHGVELAVSVDADSIWASPRDIRKLGRDPQKVARTIAPLLGLDLARMEKRFARDRAFIWLKRGVSPRERAAVDGLKLPGVYVSREAKRFYPGRSLAAHLLGFANVDGKGIEGLELAFEEELRGHAGAIPALRDGRRRIVFSAAVENESATRGHDLHLTIDRTLQRSAERELELAARTYEAKAGSIVMMDPRTGELLAAANYPTFNPNDAGNAPPSHRRNRLLTDRFEPGSTIKVFTAAGAFAAGAIRPRQAIDCNEGKLRVAQYTIHDSHRWDHPLTPTEILARSSNIGTVRMAEALGREGLYRTLRRFGFGQVPGLPLPAQTKGRLSDFKRWYDMDAATISFGQGMSASTMQLAVALGAVANRGKRMTPLLVKRVTAPDGSVVRESQPEVKQQVVPAHVATMLAEMLTAVTSSEGTAPEAAIDGYLVAGKTGTAQKADPVAGGYAPDKWVSSFIGFVPARSPRLVVAVVLDEPAAAHYGGKVAGPVFRRVARSALAHLGVPAGGWRGAVAEAAAGQKPEAAEHSAAPEKEAGLLPALTHSETAPEGTRAAPDLKGKTARAALIAASTHGFSVEMSGSGVVVAQDPAAGQVLGPGRSLRLSLSPPGEKVAARAPQSAEARP